MPRDQPTWPRWILLALPLSIVLAAAGCLSTGSSVPQNLLLITLDTTRADHLGCYGDASARTPNIDRVAARGVRFDNAYTTAPLTLPAHATILTGTYPTHHRIHYNGTQALHPDAVTLAEKLREQGFATGAAIGAYVLHHQFGLDQGFDVYHDAFSSNDRPASAVTRDALRFLDERNEGRFFLWAHYFDPHAPYEPPPVYAAGDPYAGEIAYMDSEIGRLLDELERRGLAEDTAIVIVGDHGEALGQHEPDHRIFIYEPTMRVPLIVHAPGAAPQGEVVSDLVATVDLFPTLCELLGVPAGSTAQGRTLSELWRGEDAAEGEAYLESHGPRQMFGWSELVGLRHGPWKLIRAPRDELYDVTEDPAEQHNLIDREPQVASDLDRRLEALVRRTSAGGEEASTTLTDEARERLASLGYVSAGGGSGAGDGPEIDPKDRKELIFRHQELRGLRKRDPEAALAGYRDVVQRYPDDLMALGEIGAILVQLGRIDEAVSVYERLIEERPDGVVGLRALSFLYLQQGRLDDALNLADAAVALNERSTQSLLIRSIVLSALERHDEALVAIDRALTVDPRHDASLLQRGELLIRAGEWPEAARTLARIDPEGANRFAGLRLLDGVLERMEGMDAQRRQVQAELARLEAEGRAQPRRINFFGGGY